MNELRHQTHRTLCRNHNHRQRGREHARSRRSPFRPRPQTNSSRDLPHQEKSRPPRRYDVTMPHADVCFWHKADIARRTGGRPLSTQSGHLKRRHSFTSVQQFGLRRIRAGEVSSNSKPAGIARLTWRCIKSSYQRSSPSQSNRGVRSENRKMRRVLADSRLEAACERSFPSSLSKA